MTGNRWTFYDPVADETYVVPINPDSMTNPWPTKTLTFARGARSGQRHTTNASAQRPVDWEFSGPIRTQAHHDALAQWVDRRRLIRITDHLARTWTCYLTSFEATDRNPTARVSWRLRYTMKVQNLGRYS